MSNQNKIVFIVNPIAGRQKHSNIEKSISDNLSSYWSPTIVETKEQGHAKQIVRKYLAEGTKNFVAVGGDGTVSELASEIFKSEASLGIIPCGSGNGLARALKIPLKIEGAVACINNRNIFKIDVGTINEKNFFCTCGVGFDAKVGKKFAKQKTRGLRTFVRTSIREYLKYKPKKYKLKIDGEKINRKAFLISVANAGQYGNNAYIAPRAKMDDGILEICIVRPFHIIYAGLIGILLFTKGIDKSKHLETISGKNIVFRKRKNYQFHIDGDPIKLTGPVKIGVIPGVLNVFAPVS